MSQEKVIYGRKFGRRTGYISGEDRYDMARAKLDLAYIESHLSDMNHTLQMVEYAKAALLPEVNAILENPHNRRRLSPVTMYFHDLCYELCTYVNKWRVYPHTYAKLAIEIEYRVECAQRYKVEELPRAMRKSRCPGATRRGILFTSAGSFRGGADGSAADALQHGCVF